jgi:hypothetical protein
MLGNEDQSFNPISDEEIKTKNRIEKEEKIRAETKKMKKKSIFRLFVVVLFILSCIFIFLEYGSPFNRFQIKGVVNNYFSALSAGQYELAKTYCVPYGSFYEYAETLKNAPEEVELFGTPTFTSNISKFHDDFIDIEIVMTISSILGTNVRKPYNTIIFLTKEKSGLLGSWKLK